MKKMILALMVMLTSTVSASAMSYEQARNEALFLTDKMAYELNLTDAQYEAAYEINLDYLMGVTSYNDVFGTYWERRNLDLSYILYSWQWDMFRAATYFYRPLYWEAGYWHFAVYTRYPHRDYFYFGRPHFYATYRGGHSWHMNGGRSYYHGRADHFRPRVADNHRHFGMRDGFDRGDFRGSRGGSSTRVTGRQDRRISDRPSRSDIGGSHSDIGGSHSDIGGSRGNIGGSRSGSINQNSNGRFGGNRSAGNMGRSTDVERSSGNINRPSSSVGSSRPSTSGNPTPRSLGGSNRPSSSSSATPSRSFGSSRPSSSVGSSSSRSTGSMGSRPSAGSSTRSAGSSSGSHGHFGGSRSR